jgi:phosphatidylinositol 4-kinase
MKLPRVEASAIRDRIMKEMLFLEEERMERMKGSESDIMIRDSIISGSSKSPEDEGIIRRELNKVDPSAVVFSESWATKKVRDLPTLSLLRPDPSLQSRIRHGSPYGHLGRRLSALLCFNH